jgi:TonB family protein
VLPALGGLFFLGSHAALAQSGSVPDEAQQKAWLDDISRKRHLAEREDSIRTGGKVEPGTTKQVNITYGAKPGEDVVTITRVPIPPASPQLTTSNGNKVFTYVEQMPHLPSGGGQQGIVNAIKRNTVDPAGKKITGRVFVKFVVTDTGDVQNTEIVKGLAPSYDATVLAAVQQLPRFEPGRQNGKPVAVTFTVPIEFPIKL